MKWYWFLLALLLLVYLAVFIRRKKLLGMQNEVWDKISEGRIDTLHPAIRDKVRAFVNQAEKEGIRLRVIEGHRSNERQTGLYNQPHDGIDNDHDGSIDEPDEKVTNAKAGESIHNFALAIDVVPIENGQANFKTKHWPTIARIGKSLGFRWGGDFKSIVDKPHFEMMFGKTLKQLQNLYAAGHVDSGGYVNLA